MSFSRTAKTVSLSLLSFATAALTGCSAEDAATADANATSRSALSHEVSGQIDVKSYPLDNPAVVAQAADGKTTVAPLAPDGHFKLGLQGEASYRLLLVNAVAPGAYYAISHIQWHHEAGFSEWANCGKGDAAISLGTISPMTKADVSTCDSCKGAEGAPSAPATGSARAGIWGQANAAGGAGGGGGLGGFFDSVFGAQGSATFDIRGSASGKAEGDGLFGSWFGGEEGSASVTVSGSVSGHAEGGMWGWIGGGAWSGVWGAGGGGGEFSGKASSSAGGSGPWVVCDELRQTARLNFSSCSGVADGLEGAQAKGMVEAEAELRSSCSTSSYQQSPQLPTQPLPIGSACAFNAQCGASAFCASSVCVSAGGSPAVH
jgi:hypothetical protein